MDYFMDRSIFTEGFDPDVMWTPFVAEDGRVGYRVQAENATDVTFIYLNPSTGGEGSPDVFVYEGSANDPGLDGPLHFYTPDFEAARKQRGEQGEVR